MDRIAKQIIERQQQKKATMLVTLTNDSENAPRGIGAAMIVDETAGLIGGTIGGGMLEYEAINEAKQLLQAQRGQFHHYGLTKNASSQLGMVCGGAVDALFTYIAPDSQDTWDAVLDSMLNHKTGWLVLSLDGLQAGFLCGGVMTGMETPTERYEITHVAHAAVIDTRIGPCYVQILKSTSRVFVFGGGHLAQELVPVLDHLGFRCIVTDDRPEFSTPALFPQAEAVYTRDFTELSGAYDIQPEDYIISVTRGHAGDYEVERFALKTPAFYIGCVGSRPKIAYVNGRLKADGFTDDDLARITAPIGLDIGSETPAEIAISIASQLIAERAVLNKQRRQAGNHRDK